MQRTVYDIPALHDFLSSASSLILKIIGWKAVDRSEGAKRYFMIFAPHTSNWDFVLMRLMGFSLRIEAYWMGKHTLFRGPFGPMFKFLGGLPIDRSRSKNTVAQCVGYYREREGLVVANAPEGTRKRVERWRTGFYHIAMGAGVPIAMAFLDYKKKEGGIGGMFHPTGDYDADFRQIHAFYSKVTPRHPVGFA